MTVGLLAAMCLIVQAPAVVSYERIPPSVSGVLIYEWRGERPPLRVNVSTQRDGEELLLRGTSSGPVVVVMTRDDGFYLIDGPFGWPSTNARRMIGGPWLRSDRGVIPPDVPDAARLQWIRADTLDGPWPRCFHDGTAWECWGVRAATLGVVILSTPGRVWSVTMAPVAAGPLRPSKWGRLLMVSDGSAAVAQTRITFGHPVAPPPDRFTGIRLETAAVPDARATELAPGIAWVTGAVVPGKGWVEVRSVIGGPVFLTMEDLADGDSFVPVYVRLPDRRVLTGSVAGESGVPAVGALVTVFRIIDPPSPAGSRVQPRRVFAAESTTDEAAAFRVGDLGEAEYEVVAWHPQLGRAAVMLDSATTHIDLHLTSSGTARGRVMAGGKPVVGVEVTSVPDAAAFNGIADLTAVKGGDARTGSDGRFAVMVAAAGGGELRVGGGAYAVKRIPLPRPPVRNLDIGDIDLGSPVELTIALDRDPGCGVRAIGPIGRTGLQVVSATRNPDGTFKLVIPEQGTWQFGLNCAAEKRSLSPGVLPIGPSQAGKEVRFTVR